MKDELVEKATYSARSRDQESRERYEAKGPRVKGNSAEVKAYGE